MLSDREDIKSFSQKIYKKFNSELQLVKRKQLISQVVRNELVLCDRFF